MKALTGREEAMALGFDPFDGDFDDAEVLSDKIITYRKAHDCHCCAGRIAKGTRGRRQAAIVDDAMTKYRWCTVCTRMMARPGEDYDYPGWERRCEIGQCKRLAARAVTPMTARATAIACARRHAAAQVERWQGVEKALGGAR